jgi:Fe/S biogenesis protein NfuA
VRFLVAPDSVARLRGATLDYVEGLSESGFKFENPNHPALLDKPLAARVQQALDEHVNPGVASHGGHVSLADVQDERVFLRFGGGCQGCGMADVTLKQGVEQILRREVPEIGEILDITDHAAGDNPYYS